MLRDLAGDRRRQLVDRDVDRQGGVDLGQLARRELHVHHRSDHPDHTALRVFVVLLVRFRHRSSFLGGGQRLVPDVTKPSADARPFSPTPRAESGFVPPKPSAEAEEIRLTYRELSALIEEAIRSLR